MDETRRLSHKYVGTEHILLGVFREGDGVGAQILRRLGLDIETVRMRLNQILNENSQQQDPFAPTSQSKERVKLQFWMNSPRPNPACQRRKIRSSYWPRERNRKSYSNLEPANQE